jgi:YgiT-type zinc finger domain-containing protein
MICLTCKIGTPEPATTTVMLERDGSLVILKNVPARICDNCGERYFDAAITRQTLAEAETAFRDGAELEVKRFGLMAA